MDYHLNHTQLTRHDIPFDPEARKPCSNRLFHFLPKTTLNDSTSKISTPNLRQCYFRG